MLIKNLNVLKKIKNDGERSIDYYENVCRNPDGGTGYGVFSFAAVEVLTDPGVDLLEPNIKISFPQKTYHYKEVSDFLEYESQIATDELTAHPIIMNCILEGEREIEEGRRRPWRDVLRED